jgi:uncharacterized protein
MGVALILVWSQIRPEVQEVSLNGHQVRLEIADTDQERVRGLSGRAGLAHGQGMLFVFERPGSHCFWMKDMRFAIDLIWLDTNGRVVGLEKNMTPGSYPHSFCPPKPAQYVIELPGGFVTETDLRVGAQLDLR